MKALVLAAGYGTRLGELTKNQPKPTIEVGGKSILERIIERLHIHGITQIIVNTHYLPLMITEKINGNAVYFYESQLLGHDGTIFALKEWLEGDSFFVINGDTISNVNYGLMMQAHTEGTILALMENWRCAGTWLYDKTFFTNSNLPVIPYRPNDLVWFDVGTPERLAKAQEYFT